MKRRISSNRIIECYAELGENLSVISYNRHSMKKVMAARNLNVFEAFKEISLRSTTDTICVIADNLSEDIVDYKEVKEFELKVDDFYFGKKIPKEVLKRLEKI
jgi:hypothetical protein